MQQNHNAKAALSVQEAESRRLTRPLGPYIILRQTLSQYTSSRPKRILDKPLPSKGGSLKRQIRVRLLS